MDKLLIANRGEIAVRIIRTARRMGIATVAVYSEPDQNSLHVKLADEAVLIGPAELQESYLNIEAILKAAKKTGADAIHPGYGFLSENAEFASAVIKAGLTFVGPSPEAISAMGFKDNAKNKIKAAGIPVVPGYYGHDQSLPMLERMAQNIGYPLLIKPVAGGGGRGMRPVLRREDFTTSLLAAKREAQNAFGNDKVILEKLIARSRHIEVQVFGDSHGNMVHLFERDCSLQRHYQKIVEEAPAPGLSERLRYMLAIAAVTAGMSVEYQNAGTVEFILDLDDLDEEGDPAFYFIEMNTRLQIEHTVTEAITGQDLVEWQLRIAKGEMLPLMQEAIECRGHAIEARIYAEDPERDFLPATGKLTTFQIPEEMSGRIDTGVSEGSVIGLDHDPLLAKVIHHAPNRQDALNGLITLLDHLQIDGVTNNRSFLARLVAHKAFVAGEDDTGFIDRHIDSLLELPLISEAALAAAAACLFDGTGGRYEAFRLNLPRVWSATLYESGGTAWQFHLSRKSDGRLNVRVNGGSIFAVGQRDDGGWLVHAEGQPPLRPVLLPHRDGVEVRLKGVSWQLFKENPAWNNRQKTSSADSEALSPQILAPMAGRLLGLHVTPGARVKTGDRLMVLEAMKTEHWVTAPFDGQVKSVEVTKGAKVAQGELLAVLSPSTRTF